MLSSRARLPARRSQGKGAAQDTAADHKTKTQRASTGREVVEDLMAELLEITRALEKVQGLSPIQRVLLTCAGTLQGTLSAYFNQEIKVSVVQQVVREDDAIERLAHLHNGSIVVCEANSLLTVSDPEIRRKLLSQKLGIGQVLETLGVHSRFALTDVGIDSQRFWRTYRLESPGVACSIKEVFPQAVYEL